MAFVTSPLSVSVVTAKSGDHWGKTYEPSDTVPVSGIYVCLGCRKEIASNANDPFPPQNKHQHLVALQGAVRWKLVVQANHVG